MSTRTSRSAFRHNSSSCRRPLAMSHSHKLLWPPLLHRTTRRFSSSPPTTPMFTNIIPTRPLTTPICPVNSEPTPYSTTVHQQPLHTPHNSAAISFQFSLTAHTVIDDNSSLPNVETQVLFTAVNWLIFVQIARPWVVSSRVRLYYHPSSHDSVWVQAVVQRCGFRLWY